MNPLLSRIADNRRVDSLASAFRRNRFAHFLRFVADLPAPVRVLDVGGAAGFWTIVDPDNASGGRFDVTLLNRVIPNEPVGPFRFLEGDARDLSTFADDEFSVVFSNSVIEHVGDFHDQRAMAAEVQRVGKRYFVQTPNRYFPIEPHFLFPLFQFLPTSAQVGLTRHFDLGWYKRIPDRAQATAHVLSHRLLSAGELRSLFPGGRLLRERFLGLTKSLIISGSK